jgi:hypothetical protein
LDETASEGEVIQEARLPSRASDFHMLQLTATRY